MAALTLIPLHLKEANDWIRLTHRHHKPVQGLKFAIGCEDDKKLFCGALVAGRPVARGVDARTTIEVTRLATDGTKNACSFLYSAAAQAAKALGYKRIQTYILESEPGTSLLASGWRYDHTTAGGDWNHSKAYVGKRRTDQPQGPKQCWVKDLV